MMIFCYARLIYELGTMRQSVLTQMDVMMASVIFTVEVSSFCIYLRSDLLVESQQNTTNLRILVHFLWFCSRSLAVIWKLMEGLVVFSFCRLFGYGHVVIC